MKESLNVYLKSIGKDPSKIWRQIEESISSVLIAKEAQMFGLMNAMHLDSRYVQQVITVSKLILSINFCGFTFKI